MDPKKATTSAPTQENPVSSKTRIPEEEQDQTPQLLVEERIVDKNGGEYIKKYLRGKFLGKVCMSVVSCSLSTQEGWYILVYSLVVRKPILAFGHDAIYIYLPTFSCTHSIAPH